MPKKSEETAERKERPQNKNLKKGNPETQFSSGREAVVKGHNGGKAAAKKRREQKTMKELLLIAMNLQSDPTKGEIRSLSDCKDLSEAKNSNLTLGDRSMLNVITKAANGDIKALEFIRDQIGEKPVQTVDVRMDAKVDLDRADIDELLSKL